MNIFLNIMLVPFSIFFGGVIGSFFKPLLGDIGFWIITIISALLFYGFNYSSNEDTEANAESNPSSTKRGPSFFTLRRIVRRLK